MKTLKFVIILGLTVLLAACASSKTNQANKVSVSYFPISNPALNATNTVTLGERMLMQADGYYADSITINPLTAYSVTIPHAATFVRVASSNQFASREPNTVILNNGFGEPIHEKNTVTYKTGSDEFCVSWGNCFDSEEANFTYHPKKDQLVIKPNSFQQVIEYNGKSGDILNFTYREFNDDLARAAFTTDFKMDLSEGNQVGYKGAVIEVIDASNSMITYKVIKNFN